MSNPARQAACQRAVDRARSTRKQRQQCSYQHRLVPLRQFGADRPKPLQVVAVPDAEEKFKDSALRNEAEADAIVDTVTTLIADPATTTAASVSWSCRTATRPP
ncbi:hypothetical protein ACQP2Y_12445 [Actinoplanes sp. CA-051413]|uniref:hypothetical protein n=1 Tax=Actinoplanes sp. CA-051413 TaxID=3239899 RepID=UPI003D952A32